MAIDYVAKTYVDDDITQPIDAQALNEDNETLVNVTKAVNGVEKTGLICSIDGNGVPNIPDAASGVTYLQDEWATTDSWSGSTYATLSVSGGILKSTVNSGQTISYASRSITSTTLREIVARVKTNKAGTISMRGTVGGVADTLIASVSAQPGIWYPISGY